MKLKGILGIIAVLIVVVVVLYAVFPTTMKSLFTNASSTRDEIENEARINNAVELARADIKEMEEKYNNLKSTIIDVKVQQKKYADETEEIQKEIEKYEDAIDLIAKRYKEAEENGKNSFFIGNREYTLESAYDQIVILKNNIENNLTPSLQSKTNTYEQITKQYEKMDQMLSNYKMEIENNKAKLSEIIAKKTEVDINRELQSVVDEFGNITDDNSVNSILLSLDKELMEYEATVEYDKQSAAASPKEIEKDLEKELRDEKIENEINELLGISNSSNTNN
jgi:phage shock protein A